jgi:hypothetical protein
MGRVINSELPAKRRDQVCRLIFTAIEYSKDYELDDPSLNDLIAFVILSLLEIDKTVAQTVTQWEKRAYWVKAENFRAEWQWVSLLIQSLKEKKKPSGWSERPEEFEAIKARLAGYKANNKMKNGFWMGAYNRIEKI